MGAPVKLASWYHFASATPRLPWETLHMDQHRNRSLDDTSHDELPADALDINVNGNETASPDDGFGQLWRKRYRVLLGNVAPETVIQTWRDRFGEFWPAGNRFVQPLTGLKKGEVALADLDMPAGTRLSTGIVVLDTSPTSFTFGTPEGHILAARITFSAVEEAGTTIGEVDVLLRPSDPIFEVAFLLGGQQREDRFWLDTLTNLARHFGSTATPTVETEKLDTRRHWLNATNIVDNAYLRTGLYMLGRPFRSIAHRGRTPVPGPECAPDGAEYDAIVVGAGPNGLAAGIELASTGQSVLILEANDTIGGGCRSAELTLPGFVHDTCSAVHPLALASPFFRTLPLALHGLEWIHPPVALAHPFDDGTAAILARSISETGESLGPDADAWARIFTPLVDDFDLLTPQLLGPFRIPRHPLALAKFGLPALRSSNRFARAHFEGPNARALFAGMAAHSFLDLDAPISASFGLVLAQYAHAVGWPIPKGGSQAIVDALAAHFRSLGGTIETGTRVASLDELDPNASILFDLTPRQVRDIAGNALPGWYRSTLSRYRYGPGVFKIDWALDGPVPWTADACRLAGTIHLGGTMEEISASEKAAAHGRHAEHPLVIAAQPSLFDPSRAPEGKHTFWGYCHVPNGSTEDMTGRIEAQIERFAPGFRDRIIGRSVLSPSALESGNANYIGGDINGGVQDLRQLFTRPAPRLDPYTTPNRRLFFCSSSTPPGGGVHGMSGYHAARSVLRRSS